MSVQTEFTPTSAPIARMLSVVLIIGQCILVFALLLFLLAAILLCLPETMALSVRSEFADKLVGTSIVGHLMFGAIVAAAWFFVLRLLRQVVTTLIHGDPFSPKNIARLRIILALIIGTELIRILKVFILGAVGATEKIMLLDIQIGTWFFIFIIAAISEAFRYGAALRAEQELTI